MIKEKAEKIKLERDEKIYRWNYWRKGKLLRRRATGGIKIQGKEKNKNFIHFKS